MGKKVLLFLFGLGPNHTITESRDQNINWHLCCGFVSLWIFPCFILLNFLFLLLCLFFWFCIYFAAINQLIGSLMNTSHVCAGSCIMHFSLLEQKLRFFIIFFPKNFRHYVQLKSSILTLSLLILKY